MQRRYELYLSDILEQINIIRDFTKDISFEEFEKDKKTIYAVTRALEIIGKAAANISEDITSKYKNIEWQAIKKFRNVIVHKY